MENADRMTEVLEMVSQDMKSDATEFDGRPFNGETVAEYFGNQGAAIAAVANILKAIIQQAPPPADDGELPGEGR